MCMNTRIIYQQNHTTLDLKFCLFEVLYLICKFVIRRWGQQENTILRGIQELFRISNNILEVLLPQPCLHFAPRHL